MATHLARQTISLVELYPTFSAADAAGNTFVAGDRVFIHLKNDNPASVSASATITVEDQNSDAPDGSTSFDADLTILLGSQSEAIVGPMYARRFGAQDTRYVTVTYDDATAISIAVLELGGPGG